MRGSVRRRLAALAAMVVPAVAAVAAGSLYQAPLTWRSDAGDAVTLDRWKGRPVVLTMVFTSCQATCPATMAKLRTIQEKFDREKIDAQFAIVSFDPARDVPERLASYRRETGHTRANWTFLVGSEEDTRMLAMLLGIKYSRNPISGDIMHDNKIVLLNGEGEVAKELLGLDASIEDFR
ncbi:MAG: SCO family protein [Deltaproteobacteria bacterium]|nr:SCO family protein [Deltaproteobacteria bacterium]